MPSAYALGLGDVRLRLTRPICGALRQYSLGEFHLCLPKDIGTMCGKAQAGQAGCEFFLFPSIVHARPSGSIPQKHAGLPRRSMRGLREPSDFSNSEYLS